MAKEKNMGFRCDYNEDGSKVCKRYKKKGGEKYGTGTNANFVVDEKTCRVRIIGDIDDSDRESVEKVAEEIENKCRKGF